MNNIVIVSQGSGKYLFSVPENVTLKEGDRVKCDTIRGITDGIAFADSAWVDENVSQLIGKLTGAKFPLKSVVGKMEYRSFDKPEGKPANKYEGMSNAQLDREMCVRGSSCHALNDGRRKHDCLFADDFGCCDVTDANRAEVIKYLLAEDAEAEPEPEDKPESIKLYCVEDYCFGSTLTGGKTYDFVDGRIKYDRGQNSCWHANAKELCEAINENTGVDSIFPLVKRPAKVGEWVLLDKDDCFHKNKQGDVVNVVNVVDVTRLTATHCFISDPTLEYSYGICVCFECDYTYVLDGYHPEPEAEKEPEPEYYSGKVVCVSSGDACFTVGKMYEFVNGKVKDDDGDERIVGTDQRFKSVDEWNNGVGEGIARFIEFKGEAND